MTERQAEIIEKSMDLIAEKGIQGLTIKNLSKSIGISEPAIYRHFASKFEILETIINSFKQNIVNNITTINENETDALTKLRGLFSSTFESLTQNPTLVSVIFSEEIFQNEKSLSEKLSEIQSFKEKMIVALLKKLQESEKISKKINPENITVIFLGTIRMIARKWKMSDYNFNLTKKGNELINEILELIAC